MRKGSKFEDIKKKNLDEKECNEIADTDLKDDKKDNTTDVKSFQNTLEHTHIGNT
jgi:hypothetical protein